MYFWFLTQHLNSLEVTTPSQQIKSELKNQLVELKTIYLTKTPKTKLHKA